MTATTPQVVEVIPEYEQLGTRYDHGRQAIWCYMRSRPRPCFTPSLLTDLKNFQRTVIEHVADPDKSAAAPIHYLVAASGIPEVFNLGGDLGLFKELINNRDRAGLFDYARACIDVLYMNAVNLNVPLTTIALVQGSALGGGFEAALSCNVLIAERSAQLGLPEILFNLFPGMGAYSLLARRLDVRSAEKLILSGNICGAEELYEMGVVDVLAEDGQGVQVVNDYIKRHSRLRNGFQAVQRVRQRFSPISYEELMDITSIWVDAALNLEAKDLRMMERLVRAQNRLSGPADSDVRNAQHVA